MPQSLTRDWETTAENLVDHIILLIFKRWPLVRYVDDGNGGVEPESDTEELEDDLHELLCSFIEEIEDCSSFEADKHLKQIIRILVKVPAHA